MTKITELSEDVRKQYHYDAGNAAAYTAQVAASIQVAARQAEESSKQQKLQQEQQAERAGKQQYVQALMDRLGELQQEEENLLARIGQLENRASVSWSNWNSQGSVNVYANDPAKADLPLLRGRLENVREEKQRITAELDRAQRESR